MPITVLTFVQDVLSKIGEGTVDTVERNEASRLAARNTVVAIRALADDFPFWPWMHNDYTAESWIGHIATLPEGVLNIAYVVDKGSGLILNYLTERQFEQFNHSAPYYPTPYLGEQGGANHYTIKNGKVYFTPYPTDEVSRNNIIFNAAILPGTRASDTEVIPVAERDLNCLLFRVCMMMAIDHLKDTALSQVYALEYERALTAAKQRMVTDSSDTRRSMIW